MFGDIKSLSQIIEISFLGIAWISVLACLARTDYNFAFALFGYYLWCTKDERTPHTLMLMLMNGVLIIVDIIWLLAVGGVWGTLVKNNETWNGLHGIHSFSIFWSVINIFTKLWLIICLYFARSLFNKPNQL